MECNTRCQLYCLVALTDSNKLKSREGMVEARLEKVLEEEFGLGSGGKSIAKKWFQTMSRTDAAGEALSRVREWMLLLLNHKTRGTPISPWQSGCPDIIPGLRAKPIWDVGELHCKGTWLEHFMENVPVILEELKQYSNQPVFQPYRAPIWVNPSAAASDGSGSLAHDRGDWNIIYLLLHNVDCKENCDRFQNTLRLLKTVPRLYQHAFISALNPGTHIMKHNGPTNKKLRVHIPLIVPDQPSSSRLRVGDITKSFELGNSIVFDDSFEHEAWNDSKHQTRLCLIFDIWHPDLSDREVVFLKFLEKGKMQRAKRLCAAGTRQGLEDAHDNFYSLLQHVSSTMRTKVQLA